MNRIKLKDRVLPKYSRGEEIANMVSHIVGGAIGIVALVLCVVFAAINDNTYGVVSGSIFGACMILLYTISSIYHGLRPDLSAKKVFQVLDHCAIYLLIAGTYTPIVLCAVREYNALLGWSMFGVIWGLAIIGIVFNSIDLKKFKKFSMISYIAMGWCTIILADKMIELLTKNGTILLIAGGVFYTIGAILYGIGSKRKYFHSVFHIFVIFGSLCHFLCILFYVM
ncbi:MAG: hemolysin III family protein [Bacilli bacterium]|nr:hemolysin III family protein [Bacilli bacterium]